MSAEAGRLITALNHPLRRRILRKFEAEQGRVASASQLSRELEMPLGNVAYHLQALARLEALKLVHTRQVRGAKEFFYATALDGRAGWVRVALDASREADEKAGRPAPASRDPGGAPRHP